MWHQNWLVPNLHFYSRRMEFIIEESTPRIIVKQRWKIDPLSSKNVGLFAIERFKKDVEFCIKAIWDNQLKVTPVGYSSFAKKNHEKVFPVSFEIQWVYEAEHWLVELSPGPRRSSVNTSRRVIKLDLKDCEDVVKNEKEYPDIFQIPVSHEFGHTIGALDEYYDSRERTARTIAERKFWKQINKQRDPFIDDVQSVMNLGDTPRQRHFKLIIGQLNLFMWGTLFQPI